MNPTYQPEEVEARWYSVWEESGAFRPEVNPDGEPFSIVIPPPNVTGVLHTGHALDHAMQDILIRRKRMQGYAALWLPGMDHAGIATQNVVEGELRKEGLTRHDLGREAFVERVWEWKATSGDTISKQMRKLGDSTDWSRERFTFDEGLSAAVRRVFVTLYDEGLMYRANRIINWCPRCHTALSEIEVEHEEDPGELTYVKYPFKDGSGHITVATTRPETMLGDTAVAVHPDDERYSDAIGKTILLPILGREIPVIADEGVEHEFGTGAVKVTPAHDPLDFEIGLRHGLEQIIVIDTEANITQAGGPYAGMDRFEAREAVRSKLRELELIDKVEEHSHSVGHCSRCHTVVEPLLSLQWFVKVQPLVGPAIDAVRNGDTTFYPRRWENNFFHWMENLHDWCVSRQLWWGHRIPAWYCEACGATIVSMDDPTECACGSTELRQDEDVLDTWFSSALWPFSTLGWPKETDDLAKYYPTSVLVTGYDIIFFWVARMMKMGFHFTNSAPFPDILIHGMVRDVETGLKMSKSKGNALDPLELIDEYGADSLRLALIQAAAPGHDIPLSVDAIDAARRFGNKLWNAVRFVVEFMDVTDVPVDGGYPESPGPEDAWILSRLSVVSSEVDRLLDDYRLSDAYAALYSFAWSELFDWYLEMVKSIGDTDSDRHSAMRQTLGAATRDVLKLFHPVIPFITEELWSHLGDGSSLIITSRWPEPRSVEAPQEMESLRSVVSGIRQFRSQHHIPRKVEIPVILTSAEELPPWWYNQVASLTGATPRPGGRPEPVAGHTRISADGVEAFIPLAGLVDVEAERPRIEKAIAEHEAVIMKSKGKLDNPNFRDRAPREVVAQEERRLAVVESEIQELQIQLAELG
ncbi:MAG: valine--tRNA ligase [Actinomycetota bacterium]|nr:valine--tRNA ligase [Actinomycetota bacterium]MDK1038081.1 valine--tRNA ligase [Actinomycetota bacterium]